jgi:hypothetical protein
MLQIDSLVRNLPPGPLDVVGDVHGECAALLDLLCQLGYDKGGRHPQGRKLVFVGDLCDRGPDSGQVIRVVRGMVEAGHAFAILGNHELNLLRADAKDGSGWFFDERLERDERYQPFARPSALERRQILDFLAGLPLVLERSDLRVVHAAWQGKEIGSNRAVQGITASDLFVQYEEALKVALRNDGSYQRYRYAVAAHREELEDPSFPMPFLEAIAVHDEVSQLGNAVKVLTSEVERRAAQPFFSSHKWRFVERVGWWDAYQDAIPVLVGHYWRRAIASDRSAVGKGDKDLFAGIGPAAWHGLRKNVFCVDFSVGGRWHERQAKTPLGLIYKLAAMRWPERELVFDTGERMMTTEFGG